MLINIQTTVQVILGEVDSEGNVTKTHPLNIPIARLDHASFIEAVQQIIRAKQQLAGDLRAKAINDGSYVVNEYKPAGAEPNE